MRFLLLDRIETLEPGRRIVTRKALTGAEEYLADHFPVFPVMPGVLMLEAMVQSAAWLVHVATDFRYSLVLLREARNVTYRTFVVPGDVLEIEVTVRQIEASQSDFSGVGRCNGENVVKARLSLSHERLCVSHERLGPADDGVSARDARMIEQHRSRFALLGGPQSMVSSPSA